MSRHASAKELQLRTKAYAARAAYVEHGFLIEHDTLTAEEHKAALCAKLAMEECSALKNIQKDVDIQGTRDYLSFSSLGLGNFMKRWGK